METKGTLSNNYRDYEKVYLSPLQLELCNVEPYTLVMIANGGFGGL